MIKAQKKSSNQKVQAEEREQCKDWKEHDYWGRQLKHGELELDRRGAKGAAQEKDGAMRSCEEGEGGRPNGGNAVRGNGTARTTAQAVGGWG